MSNPPNPHFDQVVSAVAVSGDNGGEGVATVAASGDNGGGSAWDQSSQRKKRDLQEDLEREHLKMQREENAQLEAAREEEQARSDTLEAMRRFAELRKLQDAISKSELQYKNAISEVHAEHYRRMATLWRSLENDK
jgi:negative regulator of genetic competence, sporulation and motility